MHFNQVGSTGNDMKKNIQNILAQNSNKSIAYICAKCGGEVAKDAVRCIYCNAKLGNIRCPFCNFIGDVDDFKHDTCPKCGRNTQIEKKSRIIIDTKKNSFMSERIFIILFTLLIFVIIVALFIFLKYFEII